MASANRYMSSSISLNSTRYYLYLWFSFAYNYKESNIKPTSNHRPDKLSSFNCKRKMDETNWSSDFYSDALESFSYINKYFKTEILPFCY